MKRRKRSKLARMARLKRLTLLVLRMSRRYARPQYFDIEDPALPDLAVAVPMSPVVPLEAV